MLRTGSDSLAMRSLSFILSRADSGVCKGMLQAVFRLHVESESLVTTCG